jgi:hypothetical protein
MEKDKNGVWKMKTMRHLMDASVADEDLPKNCLHLF